MNKQSHPILTVHYVGHAHLSKSLYPKGWSGKIDKLFTTTRADVPNGVTSRTPLTGTNLPTGGVDPCENDYSEVEADYERDKREEAMENQSEL